MENYKYEIEEDLNIKSIVNDYVTDNPSVVDRFFTRFYKIFTEKTNETHSILFHSNRVCLLGLAADHIALKKGVTKVNYDIGNIDRSANQVKGKGKKGGMLLQPSTTIAIVHCKDGSEYKVQSCIPGKLLEINKNLKENPELVSEEGYGYIAVVLCRPEYTSRIKNALFSQVQYEMLTNNTKANNEPEK